ncbi:MerR family transcriptional regulator [Nocardiopsis synnemataformans]|uniref:MerR family transcriptional regulator n=1 Tax=Nocardiopsis synnemataformans TaxID=61305 RepID=UPI003EBC5E63
MLPIGSFSELTGLSHKALRHYHSLGLLVPARVDEDTQFRWYTVDQIERAGQIVTLRRAGMGLDTARLVVDDPGLAPDALGAEGGDADYRVCVPVAAVGPSPSPLPEDVELMEYGEDTEAWLLMPGRESLGGLTLALTHLFGHEVEGMFADVGALRQSECDEGVEFAIGMRPLAEAPG